MDTPTVGRIVRYVLPEGTGNAGCERPAIITGIDGDAVNLSVFYDKFEDGAGESLNDQQMVGRAWSCQFDEAKSPGTWHWPERA